jgi:hypothetical protein
MSNTAPEKAGCSVRRREIRFLPRATDGEHPMDTRRLIFDVPVDGIAERDITRTSVVMIVVGGEYTISFHRMPFDATTGVGVNIWRTVVD